MIDLTIYTFCKILFRFRLIELLIIIIEIYITISKTKYFKIYLLLADSYSQKRNVQKECSILIKAYNFGLISKEDDIARLAYNCVIAKKRNFLKYLINKTKNQILLNYFLKGLNDNLKNKTYNISNYIKINKHSKKIKYNHDYINICKNFDGFNKGKKKFNFKIKFLKRQLTDKAIVLISCDLAYFSIFAKNFIENFKNKNNNLVHFHVVTDSKDELINKFNSLNSNFRNLGLSYEKPKKNKNKIFITMSRFLICSLIMKNYKNDVFINDIDFSPNYKLDLISKTLITNKYDVGFYDENQKVPWTKFAAGCCYFRYKRKLSNSFLNKLSCFYRYKLENPKNTYWTVDQLGLYLIASKMKKNFRILNFFQYKNIINFNKLIKISKLFEIKKINAKFRGDNINE